MKGACIGCDVTLEWIYGLPLLMCLGLTDYCADYSKSYNFVFLPLLFFNWQGYSRTRELDSEELLEQLPALQQLLYRLIGCKVIFILSTFHSYLSLQLLLILFIYIFPPWVACFFVLHHYFLSKFVFCF